MLATSSILSVIVILVTEIGDKVVYRLCRSKGHARHPTACGGPTRGRRGDRSLQSDPQAMTHAIGELEGARFLAASPSVLLSAAVIITLST